MLDKISIYVILEKFSGYDLVFKVKRILIQKMEETI